MGSAKVSNAKPQIMENRSFKPISLIKSFFKDKKKEKAKEKELIDKQNEQKKTTDTKAETTVASILEPFKKLEIEPTKPIIEDKEDDELDNFTFKLIEDDRRSNRIDSQSSEDSGFTDVTDTLDKLTLHDKTDHKETQDDETQNTESKYENETKDGKGKKSRLVRITRAPVRGKVSEYNVHPYAKDDICTPISQINKQTLSGGQVIVNSTADTFSELDVAFQSVAKIYNSDPVYWEDVLDIITKDKSVSDEKLPISNPIVENLPRYEDSVDFTNLLNFGTFPQNDSNIFPTPPRSENVPSPLSESQAFYASNSEYTLSPERSSPMYHSDFEKCQEISPISYDESFEEKDIKKDADRSSQMSQTSVTSMTMKNFKDLQKEISNEFSKKECCDINRKSTKEIFEEHMQKLKAVERKNLCLKVSKLDLKTAYGVLHRILLSLSKECEREEVQFTLFALVCQRVLAQSPSLFVGDFGLSVLKAAALRCPQHPLLTRHVVHCVYLVLRSDPKLCANECVFHEVDLQGDNLVTACARGGDSYALVLAEITRSDARGDLPPLFRPHHTNSDGYTALHVACRAHSAASTRLHVVHVLLDHGHADIWKGDIKGGDTALHLAVNSATCCLRLVMALFKHQDRKQWKKLAHLPNMSSVTPLEYARSACKSTTRQNYPHEVLDFLKKCR